MIDLMDDLGQRLQLDGPARRIVSLVPSITETLFHLGAGGQVAAVTEYCIHPGEGIRDKPKVGGTKNFAIERILSLRPDLVIANAEENRRHQVERLRRGGVPVFVTFPKSLESCRKTIADIGALSGREREPGELIRSIDEARAEVRAGWGKILPRVLCPIWKDPYMTINGDTFIDSVIRTAGGLNVFEGHAQRYPAFSLDELAAKKPDVILLPTEPYHFKEADKDDFQRLAGAVPAVRSGRIHVVEGELLGWYGPRVPRALREISALLAGA